MSQANTSFDNDTFHDYVVAHGYGAPTTNGVNLGKRMMSEGSSYADAAFDVVALGMVDEMAD
tara:strand:- start:1949 stop:2134 length:186 start_codon:yes stop_codon:yes gene_type:complete